MKLIDRHISQYLHDFVSNYNLFECVYNELSNPNKETYKSFLKYIDKILIISESSENNFLHLHFEDDFEDDVKMLIAEYVAIKQFKNFNLKESFSKEVDSYVMEQRSRLKGIARKLTTCPDGASGNKGGNKIFKSWQTSIQLTKQCLEFYERIEDYCTLTPKTLFNCQTKTESSLLEIFPSKHFLTAVAKFPDLKSYCVINSENGLNELDSSFTGLIDNLETIILFDCERKKIFSNLTCEEILRWNRDEETIFKNYIFISFGKYELSFNSIRNKLELIGNRFRIPNGSSYTILSSETNSFLTDENKKNIPTDFIGFENSTFWSNFLIETSIRELYELRSFKMMNLYSTSFNDDIKNYILQDLFSPEQTSSFISLSTKEALLELRSEDRELIYEALTNTLDSFIGLNLKDKIIGSLTSNTVIVISDLVLKDKILQAKVFSALKLGKGNKLTTWEDIDMITSDPVIIVSYRDQGKYPYYFYPNLIESTFDKSNNVSAFFIKCFWELQYQWSNYYLARNMFRYLDHPIRRDFFGWDDLRSMIDNNRPNYRFNINWILENEYSHSESRDTIRIKFKNPSKIRTFSSSDLFITRVNNQTEYKVEKSNELVKIDLSNDKLCVQNLNEIQEDINIYEKIADLDQQKEELRIIQNKFNINDKDPSKLWKLLLKYMASSKGGATFYNELKQFLEAKSLRMVSFSHFENSWINPESESLTPLSNKVFIAICEYLGIPKSYYIIMQRIKNTSKLSSRQSTRQMNNLLRDLFNDGCFDDLTMTKSILSRRLGYYKQNHPLDELGIDEDNIRDNLFTLVELITPELNLQEVETFEKIEL